MGKIHYQFEDEPSQALTDKAFALQQAGKIQSSLVVTGTNRRFVASGQCPRCGGHFDVDRPFGTVILKLDRPRTEVVNCNGPAVAGTPTGKVGCGACFVVYAPVAVHTGGAQ